ncbi:MAG TPA: serine protease [Thermoanaerobaculia bacterium]|nr:serine protease [Thermoanaerobaculia bacterium]
MPEERDARWFAERMPSREVLQSVLHGDPVKRLLGIAAYRAIANPSVVPVPKPDADEREVEHALKLAIAAAKKVAADGENAQLSEDEKEALELFVLLVSRPAILVQDGRVRERPENWPEIARDEELLPKVLAGVGRIERASGVKCGTGFVAGERRVLTNNHVICALFGQHPDYWKHAPEAFAKLCDEASREWSDTLEIAPVFELRGEAGSAASSHARISRILGHHANVDMAVLELDAQPAGARRLALAKDEPASFKGRRVYAVGYPVDDVRDGLGRRITPAHVFHRIFGNDAQTLGRKRFSPGCITKWSSASDEFQHDASTLPGSSGSCIVDFEERRVVGLHFAGSWEQKLNLAVPLWKFRADPVLAKNGVKF